jgi:hypothetical protein
LPEFKKAGMEPSSNNNDANDNNELFIPGKYYKSLNFLSFYAKFMRKKISGTFIKFLEKDISIR